MSEHGNGVNGISRRTVLSGAAVAAVGSLLAGCVGTSNKPSSTTTSSGDKGDSQTVTVWSWFVKSTMDKAIKAYEKANPGVTINYSYYNYDPEYLTALKTAARSGTLPDVIGLQPGSLTQQYRSQLAPLQDLAAKSFGSDWEKQLAPVNLQQMRLGNPEGDKNYYMVAHESQVLCVWYNREAFAKLKLSVPTTFDELVAVSKKLRANSYLPMYQGAAGAWQNENVFLILANQLRRGITDDAQAGKVQWTAPELVEAMTAWRRLFTDGVFQDGALGAQAYPTGAQLFGAGKVGMMTLGSWWLQQAQLDPPIPPLTQDLKGFDYFDFPAIHAGGKPGAVVGGIDVGYGLTKNGEKKAHAWKFLASLVNGDAGKAALVDVNDLPAFNGVQLPGSVSPHVTELYDRLVKQLPDAVNQRFASPSVQTALDNALAAVAAGQQQPKAALAKVQAAQAKALGG
ncbi:ABC transporter substrate-binding protein [Actinopolymorpha alba]|uniref:ABC transporter substrate-binding protein n=1 Tax=Actinopolymorpha alba TaxID=533267 RepID=UPI00036F8E57|nr:extracellular solute-binding protein [Actinopolymorpha alba]